MIGLQTLILNETMDRRKFVGSTLGTVSGLVLIRNVFGLPNLYGRSIKFNNNASQVGFIGDYNSVEELIAADIKELARIGGSFEEIADRIKGFLDYAENEAYGRQNKNSIDPIVINAYLLTRGMQICPFEGCKAHWNDIVFIQNSESGKKLTINKGIEHLARDHHLLEKGNEYEIIPVEFYKHFMP